jgi:geranylgeranyl pyrophosphate synthase
MEEAAVVRRAALDATEDVEPAQLRDRIAAQLERGSMVPGVLTLLTVRALSDGASRPVATNDGALLEPVAERAAGVQLIYDGLRLTRQLSQDEPWTRGEKHDGDMAILAADVLVARGFYLLARSESAEAAVATVRAFGRDQTVRRETDDPTLDRNLETDVLELAVAAGATMVDRTPSPRLREYAADLTNGSAFPESGAFFSDSVTETLGTIGADATGNSGVTTSADH